MGKVWYFLLINIGVLKFENVFINISRAAVSKVGIRRGKIIVMICLNLKDFMFLAVLSRELLIFFIVLVMYRNISGNSCSVKISIIFLNL